MNSGITNHFSMDNRPLAFIVAAEEHGIWKWDLGRAKVTRPINAGKNTKPVD